MIYGTRGVVERLIQHEAKPSAVSASRPQPECHKSRNARSSTHYLFYWDVCSSNTLTHYSRSTLTSSLLSVANAARIRLVNGLAVIELLNLNARIVVSCWL